MHKSIVWRQGDKKKKNMTHFTSSKLVGIHHIKQLNEEETKTCRERMSNNNTAQTNLIKAYL